MKTIVLGPEDLPLVVRLKLDTEEKEYLLLKTRQDRLLLNKSIKTEPTL